MEKAPDTIVKESVVHVAMFHLLAINILIEREIHLCREH